MKAKFIKIEHSSIYRPYSLFPNLFYLKRQIQHSHWCESKHGFSCDCCTNERKVILAIKKGKKRYLVKGRYCESENEFIVNPSHLAKLENLIK